MATKPETNFINAVHRKFPKGDSAPWHEKMHNPYRSGTADVWYSGCKGDLWVEYKFIPELPAWGETRIVPDLSPLQRDWLGARYAEGRNTKVIVGHPTGGVVFLSPREWSEGLTMLDFVRLSVTKQQLAEFIMKITGTRCTLYEESLQPQQPPMASTESSPRRSSSR